MWENNKKKKTKTRNERRKLMNFNKFFRFEEIFKTMEIILWFFNSDFVCSIQKISRIFSICHPLSEIWGLVDVHLIASSFIQNTSPIYQPLNLFNLFYSSSNLIIEFRSGSNCLSVWSWMEEHLMMMTMKSKTKEGKTIIWKEKYHFTCKENKDNESINLI